MKIKEICLSGQTYEAPQLLVTYVVSDEILVESSDDGWEDENQGDF